MTSLIFARRRAQADRELRIFNSLPRPLRDTINNCNVTPPKASIVRDALLRGVSESEIIATINKPRSKKDD
jgi:hypothetical protein